MVKSIVIDESANAFLNQVLHVKSDSSASKTGLLIGTIGSAKDYILNVVATPIDDGGGGGSPGGGPNSDKEWIVNHALQVHDMLIGGMDILGVYCIDFAPALSKQILIKLFKSLNEFDYYKQMKFNSERLLFLVDSSTKNINMKCLDVKAADSKLQSCEIKIQKSLSASEFYRLDSNFNFNTKFKTPNIRSHNLLKEDFYNALSVDEMFDNQKFLCLINDTLIDENKTFAECRKLLADESEYFVTLLENLSHKGTTKSGEQVKSHSFSSSCRRDSTNLDSIYELTGVSYLVVLVHDSTRVLDIKKSFVYDLMRSLYARVRLLVEDLDARKEIIGDAQLEDPNSNDVSAIEESYQTPNRIFIYMNISNGSRFITISDYVFPDETDTDISERIKQLFDYDIVDTKNDIVYVEDLPPEIRSSQSENDNNIETSTHSTYQQQSSSNTTINSASNAYNSSQTFKKGQDQSSANDATNSGIIKRSILYVTAGCAAVASLLLSYYTFRAANFLNDDNEFS